MTVDDYVTTALDAIAFLALGVGILAGLWPLIHGWAIACGGIAIWTCVRGFDGDLTRWVGKLRGSLK